jgi:hypothetical protein
MSNLLLDKLHLKFECNNNNDSILETIEPNSDDPTRENCIHNILWIDLKYDIYRYQTMLWFGWRKEMVYSLPNKLIGLSRKWSKSNLNLLHLLIFIYCLFRKEININDKFFFVALVYLYQMNIYRVFTRTLVFAS